MGYNLFDIVWKLTIEELTSKPFPLLSFSGPHYIMQSILDDLFPAYGEDGKDTIVLVDEGMAELLKWNGEELGMYCSFPTHSLKDPAALKSYRNISARLVVLTTSLDVSSAFLIKEALNGLSAGGSLDCVVLTTVSSTTAGSVLYPSKQSNNAYKSGEYSTFVEFLAPYSVLVRYFPIHTIELFSHNKEQREMSFGILSALSSRRSVPISLRMLREANISRDYTCMADVNASDLPSSIKANLKSLTYDLAGSILFDYGLNVSDHVYALGWTSSIVGHNLLPILEELSDVRQREEDRVRYKARLGVRRGKVDAPLQAASLILIDRCEDLLSPASTGSPTDGGCPLAHRIVNTLNLCQYNTSSLVSEKEDSMSLSCDVTLRAPVLQSVPLQNVLDQLGATGALSSAEKITNPNDPLYAWNNPMTALANLPLQLNPSIKYCVSSENKSSDEVSTSVMCGSEEEGKIALCKALKTAITSEGGTLPPTKKRGLGAEVLAYTQALLQTPLSKDTATEMQNNRLFEDFTEYRNNSQSGLGFNFFSASRTQGLLAVSLAVIEAMQRSNGKQFQSMCDWQCSFDVRTARETELDGIARKFQDFDVCIAHLMSYFLPNNKFVVEKNAVGEGSSAKSKEKDTLTTTGPVDLVHILAQLIRVVSRFRQIRSNNIDSSNFSALSECISEFLLRKSCKEEVVYLQGIKFLPKNSLQEILHYRSESAAVDALLSAQCEQFAQDTADASLDAEIDSKELTMKQLQSSLRDSVNTSISRFWELRGEFFANQQRLLAQAPRSTTNTSARNDGRGVIAADKLLNLMEPPLGNEITEIGLIGRIAQSYLIHRLTLHRTNNMFVPVSDDRDDADGQDLLSALEFIESPLDKMKRAGLGLLSKGLGSLGFGFGGQVVPAVTSPHPSELPVLVIFVLGGMSFREAGQVQQAMRKIECNNTRIILLSTRTLGVENVLYQIFC